MRIERLQRDYSYLKQMMYYIEEVENTLRKIHHYNIPITDEMSVNSLAMVIGQIGEQLGSGKLSEETQEKFSDIIPFQTIKGFRNRAYHDYGSMKAKIIIETAIEDIPKLREDLEYVIMQVEKELSR
ncbi:putative toxin-antitoxin system, antitoxin component [Streptococcus sp. oral taxon 056 str. F0418]|uniref:HepT-like ribonuclease domain-containing protein n=1 Tax=Streptococcus sp. oral taxon 056 TaxID=712620 RepID=UPI00021805B1|nr:HepT-like ribonuclease domain-containing protein [Streptococcus sp. oral taxon 056]EGP66080.1 putative toxin-antitoxin system, antitoxin component [Streptococcus sp. oral taxon 056 str. F0418]